MEEKRLQKNSLLIADELVNGARQKNYGAPIDNHQRTADFWTIFFRAKFPNVVFTPEDVCWFNILQKISREMNAPKADNRIDVAGYVRNLDLIESEREHREKQNAISNQPTYDD